MLTVVYFASFFFSNMSEERNTKWRVALYFLNILGLASFLSGQKEKYLCVWLYRGQQIHLTWLDMGLMVCQQVYDPFYVMQTSSFNSHKWTHTPVGTLWHRGGVALWGGSSWVQQCSRKRWRVWLWNKEGDLKRQKNKTAMKTSEKKKKKKVAASWTEVTSPEKCSAFHEEHRGHWRQPHMQVVSVTRQCVANNPHVNWKKI